MSEHLVPALPRDPYTTEPTPKSVHGRLWFVLRIAYFRFASAGSPLMAAAIAFYSLMCFMPLGIFMVWALSTAFGGEEHVINRLQSALTAISPATAKALTDQIRGIFSQHPQTVTGVLGALSLVWAGHRLFEILEIALTSVWHGRAVRGILMRKVFAFAMLIAACALLGAYMFAVSGVFMVRSTVVAHDPGLEGVMRALWRPLIRLIAAGVACAAFFLIYYFLPRDRVPPKVAAIGALVATALWQAATELFGQYIGQSASYQNLYGSMVSVVLFGLWAYTAGIILLVSAALSSAYFAVVATPPAALPPRPQPVAAEEGKAEGDSP